MKKKIYFENLDGLRFFCFLSVFFFHFHTDHYTKDVEMYDFFKHSVFGNGSLGVNFFFVISGFLITYLLIEEKKLNGQINLKNFWIRRILRIWPLFYFCVLFGFFAFPLIKSMSGQPSNETASLIYYLTFLNNFDFINKGLPDSSILGVLWSVAIEEQFYLVWPLILYLLPIRRYWIVFCVIIVTSFIYRSLHDTKIERELHTLSCIGDMAIGAFGAWLIIERERFKNTIENLKRYQIVFVYIVFVLIYLFRDEVLESTYVMRIFERALIAVFILLIILEQNYAKNSFYKISRFKAISQLGVVSYGLYCYHYLGILITIKISNKINLGGPLWVDMILELILALVITIIIARLSYRFYETPFLKLKDRFAFITKK
ncbi:MAG TPA: acyltransferase [Ohtaekwangia sp.]